MERGRGWGRGYSVWKRVSTVISPHRAMATVAKQNKLKGGCQIIEFPFSLAVKVLSFIILD